MNRRLTLISIGILILVLFLFTGFPVEFREIFTERIAKAFVSISLVLIFIKLFQLSKKIEKRKKKIFINILISIVFVPYLFICIYNFSCAFSNNYTRWRWKDISIYEDKNGNRIAYQLRETSGSIYDYRYRKIYYENKSFRISTNCNFGSVTGWSEKKIN